MSRPRIDARRAGALTLAPISSVRYNLDPFEERTGEDSPTLCGRPRCCSPRRLPLPDAEIWAALERAGLRDWVTGLDGGLAAPLTQNGGNLSAGQAQLICLARALVRQAKIIFLDESTSALDDRFTTLVDETLRGLDATVVHVAHRTASVIDYDRIVVMDAGRLAEDDAPAALAKRRDSRFSSMIQADGRVSTSAPTGNSRTSTV